MSSLYFWRLEIRWPLCVTVGNVFSNVLAVTVLFPVICFLVCSQSSVKSLRRYGWDCVEKSSGIKCSVAIPGSLLHCLIWKSHLAIFPHSVSVSEKWGL